MIDELCKELLRLSEQLRPNYPSSLGNKVSNWEDVFKQLNIIPPEIFRAIYSNFSGTKRDIKEQKLMDFTPGYRLIHILELFDEMNNLANVLNDKGVAKTDIVIPLLANYSSDFICYFRNSLGEERICALMNDCGELIVMHDSPKKFLETICEFYKQGVYFLDADGYLDYDMDREGEVGATINPGVSYWEK